MEHRRDQDGFDPLLRRRCVCCGYDGEALQDIPAFNQTGSSRYNCPSCNADLYVRPARSYAELEGLDDTMLMRRGKHGLRGMIRRLIALGFSRVCRPMLRPIYHSLVVNPVERRLPGGRAARMSRKQVSGLLVRSSADEMP